MRKMKEVEFFGTTIVERGENDFVAIVKDMFGDDIELHAKSIDSMKEKLIIWQQHCEEMDIWNRIANVYPIQEDTFKFFLNMIVSFHSTRGAALMRISDYLDKVGL